MEVYRWVVFIDGVISDNDFVVLVYKLEEICIFMCILFLDIVWEFVEWILKWMDYKSFIVK